jgi:hypothetical protein
MPTAFHLPTNLGNVAIYVRPILTGQVINSTPLTRAEQATIDTQLVCKKHYFLLMCNIKHRCFTALDASINNAYMCHTTPKSKDGMQECVPLISFLDQLSSIYSKPTPVILEQTAQHSAALIWQPTLPKSYSDASRTAPRSPF